MVPLAHNPSSELHVVVFNAIRAIVHKTTRAVAGSYSDGLPSSVVCVSRERIRGEWVGVDVELEVGVVEESARATGAGNKDWVGEARTCVICFH